MPRRPGRPSATSVVPSRRVVAVWAGLCLGGLAATSALTADPSGDAPGPPGGEPSPGTPYAVGCREIADEVEQARAEAERERREALDPSAGPAPGDRTLTATVVPEECADVLRDRGLTPAP
ncbi:hypothetical protein [Streptomyces capillispiralis]|uniref:Secreted protein n=1 Tax=Streptomyces capillispiralis TaxID=68182 RepID=A0A561TLJ0_9ACTN|nr:hypothetical protein [Streptomyces capillispiralis]TWF87961.1 hypothetical protein FHX78_114979 [Streptomyces capillispiralis]